MDRKHITVDVETTVLLKSRRRCALCFHLNGDLAEKCGQIAHLNQDPSDSTEDNLAWICLEHHTLYDSRTSQHKNYTIQEVKEARVKLYEAITHADKSQPAERSQENSLTAKAAMPVAFVELGKREGRAEVMALCYNLGDSPFVVDQLIVRFPPDTASYRDLEGPHVVRPGDFVAVSVDCAEWLRSAMQEASIVFQLQGATGRLTTRPAWFYFYPEKPAGYDWRVGRLADRRPGAIVQQPRIIPA